MMGLGLMRWTHPKTLWRYLWGWVLGALALVWLTLMAVAWYTGHHETEEMTDGHMMSVARFWWALSPLPMVSGLPAPLERQRLSSYVQDVSVVEWRGGRVAVDTHGMLARLGLNPHVAPELGTSVLHDNSSPDRPAWRMLVVGDPPGAGTPHAAPQRRVAVLMNMSQRTDLGRDVAEHVARPALLVLPLVALGLWWTIRRGLRPLDRLSRDVAGLDVLAGQRLGDEHRFSEFSSTVQAINALVDTLQTRAQRERAFASDVAHELRTPLSAIALQARAAQHDPCPARLAQLEQEALRAGRILTQLLDLARAQHTDPNHHAFAGSPGVRLDLGALAIDLIARHVPMGQETGHELSLVQPDAPVWVQAPPMLVELAMRNLIENALRHTPRGTQVCVQLWQTAQDCGFSVSDDGQRASSTSAPQTHIAAAEIAGLGLGLRLVERIAAQMGAAFLRETGPSPMTTRFTVRWVNRGA